MITSRAETIHESRRIDVPTPWDVAHPTFTNDELLDALRKGTPTSQAVAQGLDYADIDLNIVNHERFNRTLIALGSDNPNKTHAFCWQNRIFVRERAKGKLPTIVHEGSHALDFLMEVETAVTADQRTKEIRAWQREDEFREANGWPRIFNNDRELVDYVDRVYDFDEQP